MTSESISQENLQRKLFQQIDEYISDEDVKEFTKAALEDAANDFWEAPASSSGKYHPPEDNGEGGTARHVIKAVEVGKHLSEFHSHNSEEFTERDNDIVVASCALHDICKNGKPNNWGPGTDYSHGFLGYEFLDNYSLKEPEKEEIRNCVRYHMAKWVEPDSEKKRAMNPTPLEKLVQYSDYLTSRENISFLPGMGVSEEDIIEYP